jgi:hypothetical protein
MAEKQIKSQRESGATVIRFSLAGLIVFSVSLVAVSALSAHLLINFPLRTAGVNRIPNALVPISAAGLKADERPWGELVTYDIELERPEEYVAYEAGSNQPPVWVFAGLSPEKIRETMLACGLTAEQVQRALSPGHFIATSSNTVVNPDDDLVLALTPPVRAKLYQELARFPDNHYMKFPFFFTDQSLETLGDDRKLDGSTLALVKQLLYPRDHGHCFSDFELVLRRITSEAERIRLVQALSRQSAVLARLKVSPDTDVDKLLGYWGAARGVRFKDVRPLLESVKRMPDGGTVSMLYLLPQFARQRLYTFPQPSKLGDPRMDCHWSTMNFFNEVPDNRFNDSAYTAKYLNDNYYPIAKPTAYGDLIFLTDGKNDALHSAVYLADDLIFTKNGDNYLQPWMLMHLKDLLGLYAIDPPPQMRVYRNKNT